MANYTQLKNLFRRVIPYTDDIARNAAAYGDHIINYADDIANLADSVDNLPQIMRSLSGNAVDFVDDSVISINGKSFHVPDVKSGFGPPEHLNNIKLRMIANQSGLGNPKAVADSLVDYVDRNPKIDLTFRGNRAFQDLSYADNVRLIDMPNVATYKTSPKAYVSPDTYTLGDVAFTKESYSTPSHAYPRYSGDYTYMSNDGNLTLPISDLVVQDGSSAGNLSLRPHKNTALGRWFANNVPNYKWQI